jgi:azurin
MLVQRVSGTIFTPERVLVVDSQGTFVLLPDDERTRLFVRSTISTRDMPIWEAAAGLFGYEVRDFIAQRALMLSVKASAEERWAVRALEEPARTVDIGGTDDMKYSVTAISAVPGERLRIRLTSRGVIPKVAMAHNVVVVHLDTDIDTMLKEGAPYRDNDFIPPSMQKQVIAKTGFAGPGETVQVTFTVPEEPGAYPFLCTFSGHYQAGMKGTLTVERKKTTN